MRVVGNAVSTTELGSIPPSSGWINTTSLECSGFLWWKEQNPSVNTCYSCYET